jgi:hypothetical protein
LPRLASNPLFSQSQPPKQLRLQAWAISVCYFVFFFWDRVLLGLAWLWTCDPPASAFGDGITGAGHRSGYLL